MAEVVHSCGCNHLEGQNRPPNGRFSNSVFYPKFFPLTTQVDFESVAARLNQTSIQFDKASITLQQWENLPH
jgi:hypothetical protein